MPMQRDRRTKVRKGRRKPSSPNRPLKVQTHGNLPPPSEEEAKFLAALKSQFEKADDIAKAISRFEANTLLPRYPEGEMSPEEFGVEHLHRLCDDLGQLALTRKMLVLFDLGTYESEIMNLLIKRIFESAPSRPKHGQIFAGNDEQLLEHQTRESE